MKNFQFAVVALLLVSIAFAQEEEPKYGWKKEAVAGFNIAQAYFDNYIGGGDDSYAWQAKLNFQFNNVQEKINWANQGKLKFGQTKIGDEKLKKSVDEIYIESVLTFKVINSINPYAAFVAETQFTEGYNYSDDPWTKISDFMDPGYFRESIGFNYAHGKEIFIARAGLGFKQTIANEFAEKYTDDPETEDIDKIRSEVGLDAAANLNYKISESSQLVSKLEIFSTLKSIKTVDVKWDTDLSSKITKHISFTMNLKLLYDRDISKKRQISESMGIGISYSFL